jgi:FkbM family methyltransferase
MAELLLYAGMWIRSDNVDQDRLIIEDVFVDDCYNLRSIPSFETVVDVGAHIGSFATLANALNRRARIFCYECCPENVGLLSINVGDFAAVVQAAVTYEDELALLNAVFPNCASTGGSTVCHPAQLSSFRTDLYWADSRPLVRKTLEDILRDNELNSIDVLKLDCEGCELSLLESTLSRSRVNFILGEWHNRVMFMDIVERRYRDWRLRILRDGDIGTFWLINPAHG